MHVIHALWYVFNCLFYLCDFSKLSLSNLKFNAANTCINCRVKPTFNETIRTVPMSWQWHTGLPFVLKSAISANVCLFVANSLPEMKWQFLKKFWPLLVRLWCLENWTFLILLKAKFGHYLFLGNRSLKRKGGLGSSFWLAGHIGNKNGLCGPDHIFDFTLR